jgi:hypothetical protein
MSGTKNTDTTSEIARYDNDNAAPPGPEEIGALGSDAPSGANPYWCGIRWFRFAPPTGEFFNASGVPARHIRSPQ